MHPSHRVPNPGILPRMASKIPLLAGGSVFGLTKLGILGSQQARVHTFGAKPNRRCFRGMISTIIESLFLDRTSVSHGIICNYGLNFMKHALKYPMWETRIRSLIISKRNTNLRRSCLARFVGTSNSSTQSVMATVATSAGVQTSAESTSPQHI